MLQLTGKRTVPTLIVNGKTFVGFVAHRQDIENLLAVAKA
jgi:glutaredoxin